jgi:predicted cation transporter
VIRIVAAVVVAGHGLIHLIGFVVPWGLAQVEGFPYRTTALGGSIALGDAGARAIGIAWLVCAVGFVMAGLGIWRRAPWALPLAAVLAIASIILCVLGLPEAVAGIIVNAVILGVVAWAWVARPAPAARRVGGPGAERAAGPAGTAWVAGSGPAR